MLKQTVTFLSFSLRVSVAKLHVPSFYHRPLSGDQLESNSFKNLFLKDDSMRSCNCEALFW